MAMHEITKILYKSANYMQRATVIAALHKMV